MATSSDTLRTAGREPRRPHRDTVSDSELVVALFRTLMVAMVLVAPAVAHTDAPPDFYLAVGGAALYSLVATLLLYRGARLRYRRHVVLVIDIVLLALLFQYTGGPVGELFPLFYLTVIIGAIWFNVLGAVMAAGLATAACAAAIWYSVPAEELTYHLRNLVVPHVLLMFLIALLSSHLAEAWRTERQRADAQRAIVTQFRQQMDMAQELQSLILPAVLPQVPGLDIGVRSRQAAVVVGGDYYDAIAFEDGALAICCADVSGKSVAGQLRLPLVKYAFRVCARTWREPGAVAAALGGLLYDELPSEMFVSMVYALVEPAAGRISLVRAGHCPPLQLVAATGEVRVLKPRGILLGVERTFAHEVVTVEFAPDDYLLLYTDGAQEAEDRHGQMLEVEGLGELFGQAAPESAQDMANWLFHSLEEYEVGAKRDDLTLVVLRRVGPPETA